MITINDIRKTYIDAAGKTPAARRQAELAFNASLKEYVRGQHIDMYGAVEVEPPAGYHGVPLQLRKANASDAYLDEAPLEATVSQCENEVMQALKIIFDAKELIKQAVCDCDVEDYMFPLAQTANQLQVVEDILNSIQEQ